MDIGSLFPAFIFIAISLVVVITEFIKRFDKKNILKGYRVYVPLVLSLGASGLLRIGNFFVPEQMWFWWAIIFGFSVFFFEAILKKVKAAFDDQG
jgi:hypothetical protein